MVILSQDSEIILNFSVIEDLYLSYCSDDDFVNDNINGMVEIRAETHNFNMVIGSYNGLERAKEVLKDMLSTYKSCNCYNSGFVMNDIYYMPEV